MLIHLFQNQPEKTGLTNKRHHAVSFCRQNLWSILHYRAILTFIFQTLHRIRVAFIRWAMAHDADARIVTLPRHKRDNLLKKEIRTLDCIGSIASLEDSAESACGWASRGTVQHPTHVPRLARSVPLLVMFGCAESAQRTDGSGIESPPGTGGTVLPTSYIPSWGFCTQKLRSTPFGALAPTRLPVTSRQREDPQRKASGSRLRRRNLCALSTHGKPPQEIFEYPGALRLRRPGRFSDIAVKSESSFFAPAKNLSILQLKTN